ncbi:MAG TPA: serine hydrolase domain-containing protein [Rhizomicrobium sp.]|jgi:CubicO group peptidase (beta-lactamase class C family)|nr:serine hydrolase domain-containing protein [Rhizomicrobium sp.]
MMSHGFDPNRLERIGQLIRTRYVDSGVLPGALTLIWRKGAVAHLSMSGMIDLERKTPMREDGIFRIYSMTKPITSVAFLMLLEEGKVALDDPVHRFIPGFENLRVFSGGDLANGFASAPAARPMKMVDLMRHTSGLTYGFLDRTNLDAAYTKLGVGEFYTEGGLPTMIAQLEKLPLEFSPGEAWNYSVSTDVLGYLVENISGENFADFVRRRILLPLGMRDTDFHVPAEKQDRFASCYYAKAGRLLLYDDGQKSTYVAPPKLESGGGGLAGTAQDYLRFCRMLLSGGALGGARLLSPKTVSLLTMNHLPGGREMTQMMPSTAAFNETGYAGVGFGLGVAVTVNLANAALPGTLGDYSWGGAAATYFFCDPREDLAVIFMTQALASPERIRLRRDLRTLVYGAMSESFA